MSVVKKHIGPILYGMFFLLMGAQIILGALWFCGNFTTGQAFGESAEFLEISRTWVLDEYVGIGYPACLFLLGWFEKLTGISHAYILYILQTGCGLGATVYFLKRSELLKKRGPGKCLWRLWFTAAYVNSVPMILQFHLALLPTSFALSAFWVVLGECLFWLKHKGTDGKTRWKSLVVIALAWLTGALLLPEYMGLLGIPVALAFLGFMWRNRKVYPALLVIFAAVILLYNMGAGFYQEPGSRGRMQQSVSATLLKRVVWPNFYRNSFFWNESVEALFSEQDLQSISCEPESVDRVFGPLMEQVYGKTEANRQYLRMVQISLQMRTKDVVSEVVSDGAGYLFPQAAVWRHLNGEGISYSGSNYDVLRSHTPVLAKYYVKVSFSGFFVMLAVLVIRWGAEVFGRLRKKRDGDAWKKETQSTAEKILLAGTVLGMVFVYTMEGAGIWDYQNVLPVCGLWAMLPALIRKDAETEE